MTTDNAPPVNLLMRPCRRLDYASTTGYLLSGQGETALRDRWARQCVREQRIIAHLIYSDRTGNASIRLNGAAMRGRVMCDAGYWLASYLVTEFGGYIRWRHSNAIVDIHSIDGARGQLVITRLLDPELWTISTEVR